MARRTGRLLLLIALLIIGGAVAAFAVYQVRHVDETGRTALVTSRRVDDLLITLQKVRDAQQAYLVVSGQHPAADEVTRLLASVVQTIAELEPLVHAVQSTTLLLSLREDARALADIEARAQDHVRVGHDLMAAELISSEGDETLGRMSSELRDLRSVELAAIGQQQTATLQQIWLAIGGAASLWLVGLLVLVNAPTRLTTQPMAAPAVSASTLLTIDHISEPEPAAPAPRVEAPHENGSVDLSQAAELCTAIGQITDAQDIEPLLARAAAILGASGVVVWMAAGDELIAASAHGYDSRALHRLGHIHRSALNATAVAWRSGTIQTVRGEGSSRGAMVAPMLGTNRCVGVLAVEVPEGREADETVQAIARFVAAQLAATLAPWPAASVTDSNVERLENVAEG